MSRLVVYYERLSTENRKSFNKTQLFFRLLVVIEISVKKLTNVKDEQKDNVSNKTSL